MPLDEIDRCGLGPLSFSVKYWATGVCAYHDRRWVSQDRPFSQASKEFWFYLKTRAKQVGRSKLEAVALWTIGTAVGAPIWFGRKFINTIRRK